MIIGVYAFSSRANKSPVNVNQRIFGGLRNTPSPKIGSYLRYLRFPHY